MLRVLFGHERLTLGHELVDELVELFVGEADFVVEFAKVVAEESLDYCDRHNSKSIMLLFSIEYTRIDLPS